jgi:hypothetical protein
MFPLATINRDYQSQGRKHRRCRRLQQRINNNIADTMVANNCIISLNNLSSSFHHPSSYINPSVQPTESLPFARVPMTAAKDRLVDHIYKSAQRYNRRMSTSKEIDNRSDDINQTHNIDTPSLTVGYSKSTTAVPLVASKVSLPEHAGAVDMMSSLPAHIKPYYMDESQCMRTDSSSLSLSQQQPLPRPKFFGAKTEQIILYKRMASCGMIVFTKTEPRVVNGLFGVPKVINNG